MKILFRLLTLFLMMPVVELALLLQVERLTNFWITVLIIAVTAVAGSYLAKREGLSAWNRLQNNLGSGGLPGDELLDGVIILVAGALLITPGVLTDFIGFIGLFPLTRGWIRRLVKRRLKKAMREGRLQTSFGSFGGSFADPSTPDEEAAASAPDEPVVGGTAASRGPTRANDAAPSPSDADGPAAPDARKQLGETPSNGTSERPASDGAGPSTGAAS